MLLNSKSVLMFSTAVAGMFAFSEIAVAQDKSDKQAAPTSDAPQLQDIVVTAQRRAEKLQSAALAATAISGDDLLDAGKVTVDSALSQTPAVRVQSSSNGGQIYIRGVGSNADSQLGDPAVNLNIDGVYQQETEAVSAGMYDIARIEVLRGPQGTLYGRNATAGAVNIITNDPVIGEVGGAYNLQFGNYHSVNADGYINAGLSETTAIRASATYQNHDGYLSNGNNDANSYGGRMKFLWQPNDRLKAVLGADVMRFTDNDFGTVEAPLSEENPYHSDKPQGYRRITSWGTHANIDYSLDAANLTLLAAHTDFRKTDANVLLGLAPAVTSRRTGILNSVEFRVASPQSSPVKWTVGTYYLDNKEGKRAIESPIGIPAASASNPELQIAKTESYAAFGNLTVPLTSSLRVTGGIRYTHDSKSARFVYTDGTDTPDELAAKTWQSFTYKGAIEADVTNNSLVYAQVSSGFKAGGFAQQFPAASYNPEKLTAFEVGSKNEFFGHTLRLNVAGYYYDYKNYQASYPDIVGGLFALVTSNAASAKLYGAEVEATYLLTRNDTIALSSAYSHSRFGTFIYTSALSGEVDHSGERLPAAPKWSFDLSYEHRFDLANGATIKAHANSHISTGYWTSVERTTDSYQPHFTRTDAFLMYEAANGAWNVRLFANNIENTAVRTLGLQNPTDAVLMLAPPRTYGIAGGVKF